MKREQTHHFNLRAETEKSVQNNPVMDKNIPYTTSQLTTVEDPINMEYLVRDVVAEVQAKEPPHQVEVEIMGLPNIQGEKCFLQQVFLNLISNAFKFTRKTNEPKIEIGSLTENESKDEVVFYVKDNGVGFNMNQTQRLFGIFRRMENAEDTNGNGIGLAITKRIIQRQGGKIWARAEHNKGATFYFSLPQGANFPAP